MRNPNLLEFGEATKVDTHRSVARVPHDRRKRLEAKKALQYPPVIFNGLQARAIARGFGVYAEKSGVQFWALAVMPDHCHAVIARHTYEIEKIANLMKGDASRQLAAENIHPFQHIQLKNQRHPPCFSRKRWVVYLFSEADISRTIEYVEHNPIKAGFKPQSWSFVKKYE